MDKPLIWCWGSFSAQVWMAVNCHKCKQAAPHQGDSWCLACCAHEALGKELAEAWGTAGSRAIASDLLVSSLRQIRAVRRLGLAGAGSSRASAGAQAGVSRTPAGSERPPEPLGPPPSHTVKAEPPSEEESEDAEESSEEEGAPAATAKSSARERSPILRQRSSTDVRGRGAGGEVSADDRGERQKEDKEKYGKKERKRERSEKRPRENQKKEHKKDSKRKRKSHRGGAKHQRLYRANEDPYRRFHHKRAEGFWDEHHSSF